MTNIISFSLYGSRELYYKGALENISLAKIYYPNFLTHFYLGDSITSDFESILKNKGSLVSRVSGLEGPISTFWRFRDISNPSISIFLSRDCDSRITEREAKEVYSWLNTNKGFHIMRDHPWHLAYILGGMFGLKCNNYRKIFHNIHDTSHFKNEYGADQQFLENFVYPVCKSDSYINDTFFKIEFSSRKFVTPMKDYHYVGEAFDQNNNILDIDASNILKKYTKSTIAKIHLHFHCFKKILKNKLLKEPFFP